MTASFVCLVFFVPPVHALADEYLSYREFIEKVRNGQVKTVTLNKFFGMSGTYIENGQEKKYHSLHDTDGINDPLLMDLLKSHKVKVDRVDDRKAISPFLDTFLPVSMSVVGCVSILLPILIFIYLIIINGKMNRLIEAHRNGGFSEPGR